MYAKNVSNLACAAMTALIGATSVAVWAQAPKPPLPVLPKGVKQLNAMYIDQKLFEPDKWWRYESADDDRPSAYAVEQESTVSIGGRAIRNVGANVKYKVHEFPDESAASRAFAGFVPRSISTSAVRRDLKRLRKGAEAVDIEETAFDPSHKPTRIMRDLFVRYDRYVVEVYASSDLRAFGPRPASGERPWMCDPIYTRVREAALKKWDRYRELVSLSDANRSKTTAR